MPWVLITPFGRPVEPDVNRNLAMVSGRIAATACSSEGPGRLSAIDLEQRHAGQVGAVAAGEDFHAGEIERRQRPGERAGVRHVDQSRLEQRGDVLELGVVLALQRIGDRDRRHRNAGGMAGERQQGVIDAVAGQNHDRPLGAQPALDQPLRQRID